MKVTQERNLWISVEDEDGGFVTSQSVEANILYLILQELKEKNLRDIAKTL